MSDVRQRIENDFKYHSVTPAQIETMKALREQILELAKKIVDVVPAGREQATALTRLEEVMMHANAGISRKEPEALPEAKVIEVTEARATRLNYAVSYRVEGSEDVKTLDLPASIVHYGDKRKMYDFVEAHLIKEFGENIEIQYI